MRHPTPHIQNFKETDNDNDNENET